MPLIKELSVILFSSFKFAMTFPLAILEYKFSILRTLLWTNIGGLLGIILFTLLSEEILVLWRKYTSRIRIRRSREKIKEKKLFTARNRRIARIKSRYGLAGIALATPFLLSIPVGAFICVRYFEKKKGKIVYLAGANLIWSVIYALFYSYLNQAYLRFF